MTVYVTIRFQNQFRTEFMGVDLVPYGPYEEGEQEVIPRDNAILLEDMEVANIETEVKPDES